MRNADSWGTAFIVFGTIAAVWALPAQPARNAQGGAQSVAASAPANDVGYKISVVAKRIPAECKSLDANSEGALIAQCQAITSGETQMTMVPVNETIQIAEQPQ
jgi:hypothetical protein